MSRRDFRCAYSGVSLLDAEIMILLGTRPERDKPLNVVSLPLWARYDGDAAIVDVNEGPNADLILNALLIALEQKRASIAWGQLGIEECAIEHVETLLNLMLMAEIHESVGLRWQGQELTLCLLEANVGAALMNGEPEYLQTVALENLCLAVLNGDELSQAIYSPIASAGPTLRAKFALSFVGLASLLQKTHKEVLSAPGPGQAENDEQALKWLANACSRFAEDALMLEALEEYASVEEEAEY